MDLPFDANRLDALMDECGADVVVATTRFSVQHLLGGYRYFFFAGFDAIGVSRYLPALVYVKGAPELACYVGCGNEEWGTEVFPLWVPDVRNRSWSSLDTARAIAELLEERGLAESTIAVEKAFLPMDAADALRDSMPAASFVDAHRILEGVRAVKSAWELELVRTASIGIIDAMTATFAASAPGETKLDIVERFRREQTDRGLVFDYCLVSCGAEFNRAPSSRVWRAGEALSLDSGGMYQGYIGDLARMAVAGAPTALMRDLLAEVESVQQGARAAVGPGRRGGDVFSVAEKALAACPHAGEMFFVAHGMGLITHEAPRLTGTGPVPYPADHAEAPLEPGMVLSIETTLANPDAGIVKLEDTLIVTEDGWEAPGDGARGWNQPNPGGAR
ncbi:Xaa-Pro peptidase family protein [Amycolatopsis sp. Hca4]|uniref:M24 family metallopeptidase n=1 Tax=Amycolatopsis sp. Hca4 TaxID=2742131 RepID=UPI0015927E95|nr:Xaa-Pro peptidase family protein [Amycolatopsis sp. Hca4]QKV74057.1 aminopeptidase P family protein [Amycolatopsis sp. Hca4]